MSFKVIQQLTVVPSGQGLQMKMECLLVNDYHSGPCNKKLKMTTSIKLSSTNISPKEERPPKVAGMVPLSLLELKSLQQVTVRNKILSSEISSQHTKPGVLWGCRECLEWLHWIHFHWGPYNVWVRMEWSHETQFRLHRLQLWKRTQSWWNRSTQLIGAQFTVTHKGEKWMCSSVSFLSAYSWNSDLRLPKDAGRAPLNLFWLRSLQKPLWTRTTKQAIRSTYRIVNALRLPSDDGMAPVNWLP